MNSVRPRKARSGTAPPLDRPVRVQKTLLSWTICSTNEALQSRSKAISKEIRKISARVAVATKIGTTISEFVLR
jgi:hypothetical protein